MKAWGFEHQTHFVWVKDRRGTGYWNRNRHELLLVGTKGNIPAPAPGKQWESVIHAPVGAHSEKPAIFYELIEDYYPNLLKIELFARRRRKGWLAWGAEAPDEL
jgi:N6-adenosine-specific RNA methylase IME4